MRILSVVVLAAACFTVQAQAEVIDKFKVRNWDVASYSDDAGAFTHCAASAAYRNGITLIFSINKRLGWSISFSNPNWQYEVGDSFNLAFTVDRMEPISETAKAITTSGVEIGLADSGQLFRRFRRGNRLRVATENQIYDFNLTGTDEMLTVLLDCARQNGGREEEEIPVASNRFGPAPTIPTPRSIPTPASLPKPGASSSLNKDSSGDPNLKAEATALAANLLSTAKVSGFRLLAPSEQPELKGEARWTVPQGLGTIQVFPAMSKEDEKSLGGQLVAGHAQVCKGKFSSGSLPDDGKDDRARVYSTCETESGTVKLYHFTVPRASGGVYVFTTGSQGSEADVKKLDGDIRAAAYQVITK